MFETEKFRFVFKKLCFTDGSGRFDTLCDIYVKESLVNGTNHPRYRGVARLHPNDAPDKITGKKKALLLAMQDGGLKGMYTGSFFLRSKRTVVWKAFWSWVDSWSYDRRGLEKAKKLDVG